MNILTAIHFAGGSVALLSGATAIAARKGRALHAAAGKWFFASMLVLGVTATALARVEEQSDSGVGGIVTCYFVVTAWVAARRRDGRTGTFEIVSAALALGMAAAMAWTGFTAVAPPTPAGRGPVFALAGVCLIAGAGDVVAALRRKLTSSRRIRRHLWRMCFAFFIATGSFFLGQQDVMPVALQGSLLLVVLAFTPLAVMALWLAGSCFRRFDLARAVRSAGESGSVAY